MRKVDRTSVPIPSRLQNLTEVNREHLTNHLNISGSVYAHNDVKRSLQMLYFDKCYICEGDISSSEYDVEHYLPKQKFPHLGYTWSNLHKACSGCNLAKEKKGFFIQDEGGTIIDIKLLDPSNPNYEIADYLSFDINSKAIEKGLGIEPAVRFKAQNTVFYLNGGYDSEYGKGLCYLRSSKALNFTRFCVEKLIEHRARLKEIKVGVDSYVAPEDGGQLEIDQNICQSLINADSEYLCDMAPFSTATRVHIFYTLKITYTQLIQIKNKMKQTLEL